jgi:hypothetical protein
MMQPTQAQMQAMHQQMMRIWSTEDPEERQRLMAEHLASMPGCMGMMMGPMAQGPMGMTGQMGPGPMGMTGQMGPGPMGMTGQMGPGPMGPQDAIPQCADSDVNCRLERMEARQQSMGQHLHMMHQMMQRNAERQMPVEGQ